MKLFLRGDIITVSAKGNEGKPRPALIVQANWLNEKNPPSYIVCLFTSEIYHELDFRPIIEAQKSNGLKQTSQIMTDKIQVVRENQIGSKIGSINKQILIKVDNALRTLINL